MAKRLLVLAAIMAALIMGTFIGSGASKGGFFKDALGKLAIESVSADSGDTVVDYPNNLIVYGSAQEDVILHAGNGDVSVGSDLNFPTYNTGLNYQTCAEDKYTHGLESQYSGTNYQNGQSPWAYHDMGWETAFGSESGTEKMMDATTLDGFYYVLADSGFLSLGDYSVNDGQGDTGTLNGVILSTVQASTPLLQSALRATLMLTDTDDRGQVYLGTQMSDNPDTGASLQICANGNVLITLPSSSTSQNQSMQSGQQRVTTSASATTTAQGLGGLNLRAPGTFNPRAQ